MRYPKELQRLNLYVGTAIVLALGSSGCRAIGTIFKAGVWVGVILVAALVAMVAGITWKFSHRRHREG
jgi:hypothetical protein